jgi:cysteine-rich repeat protein
MSSLAKVPMLLALAAIGCGARSLAPSTGGTAGAGGGAGRDAGLGLVPDARRDVSTIEVSEPPPPVPPQLCGNGIVDPGETCDDGNRLSGDGCNPLCQIECSFECGSCGIPNPCTVNVVCGDGVLGSGEACDDGNTKSGDGCSANCTRVEVGWTCPIRMGRCFPICGDGVVVGPETCDDANVVSGDGCSAFCLVEPTTAFCGDRLTSGAEQCDLGPANGTFDYGGCTADCHLGPYCGDGVVNGGEECDLGTDNNRGAYGDETGCTRLCQHPHFCGDGFIDLDEGETCDDGPRDGMSGSACWRCQILIR